MNKDAQPSNTERRTFLKAGMALAGAAATLPHFSFNIISKPKATGPIVGQGDFKYRVNKEWGVQDATQIPVKNCHEMVQDKQGRLILLTDETRNNVIFYDRSGKVLKTWGIDFPGAHGLTISDEGGEEFLYITDTVKHQVFKTTLEGELLMTIDCPLDAGIYGKSEEFVPTETAIAPNGDIYVADGYGKDYISVFDGKGQFKSYFGGKGDGDGHFDCAHGITLDTRQSSLDSLLVTSRTAQKFKRFSLEGEFIESIDVTGMWPCRPVIKGDDLYFAIIVTNSWWDYDGFVAVFDKNHQLKSAPGANVEFDANGALTKAEYDRNTFLSPMTYA